MFNKLAFRVTVIVNVLLLVVISLGGVYLAYQQAGSLERQMLKRGQLESAVGARFVGQVLEGAIDNGGLTLDDVFDQNYQKIPGFDPPKYHTRYDSYLDNAILGVQDEFLLDESVVFAVAVDNKGYLPTHNTRFQQPPTGDAEKDLAGNRTKRLFNDRVGIKAARNIDVGFKQVYQRDTGEVMWDISSPIYVKGRHWGNFRVAMSLQKLQADKTALNLKLALILGGIFIASTLGVWIVVHNALKPLSHFTQKAEELANGHIGEKIAFDRKDEIGRLADVLERLRLSLKVAMKRLQQQRNS